MNKEIQANINFSKEIQQICAPLFSLDVTSFNFVRTYNDGSQINLCNSPEWLEYFYKNNFHKIGNFEDHPQNYESGFALWKLIKKQQIFCDARNIFSIDNGITIIEKNQNYCEFYFFGTLPQNESMPMFFANNLDLLKRFSLYFKDKANLIIKDANKSKIVIPDRFVSDKPILPDDFYEKINNFIQNTKIKKYYFAIGNNELMLSSREMDCLACLLEGNTLIETGQRLYMSPKTVEAHLNKVKFKTGCENKSALINFFYNAQVIPKNIR